ncbi:MAG TPA: alpha/beta fold hydrolase [Myxococcota bacterium]|nr:alpha/beta fold hydrolase [Myxococcota bacterium]
MKLLPTDWRPVQDGYEVGPADAPLSVVLIPGIRGDPREFIKLAPLIGGRIRILRTPEDMEPSLRSMADRVLSGLPNRPFHLIGASFGGLLGVAMPPSRLRSLTTIGSMPTRNASASKAGLLGMLIPALPEPIYRLLYGARVASSLRKDGPELGNLALPSQQALSRRLKAIAAWELPDRPSVPTRCLWGADDAMVSWTEAQVQKLGMESRIVPGGHFPHLSNPEAVSKVLPFSAADPERG